MPSTRSNIVDIDVEVHAQTPYAVLVSDDGERDNAVWLPLSQIEITDTDCGPATVSMPEWLAIDKKLI